MAVVYKAYDNIDDRIVAVKILKEEFTSNDEFLRRFKNESKAIAMLSHPNIVKVYDVSFGDLIQYIVMEYIEGITLKEYIEREAICEKCNNKESCFPYPEMRVKCPVYKAFVADVKPVETAETAGFVGPYNEIDAGLRTIFQQIGKYLLGSHGISAIRIQQSLCSVQSGKNDIMICLAKGLLLTFLLKHCDSIHQGSLSKHTDRIGEFCTQFIHNIHAALGQASGKRGTLTKIKVCDDGGIGQPLLHRIAECMEQDTHSAESV